MKNRHLLAVCLLLWITALFTGCQSDDTYGVEQEPTPGDSLEASIDSLTIFFVNDQHGVIDQLAKIKTIVENERKQHNTLLVCAGDVFSGNPIVDQFEEKGYPMIDLMNQTGFDIATLGNHEFDYGTATLADRIEQSNFPWVCANIETSDSKVPQPDPYVSLTIGDLKITVLGLIETDGIYGETIPSTHPWRVENLSFQTFQNTVPAYSDLKETEDSDLVVALTHLGKGMDLYLARFYPFMDVVIGGHSHDVVNEIVGEIPVVQAGSNLYFLGKMQLAIEEQSIVSSEVSFINLAGVQEADEALSAAIADYNSNPYFAQVIGTAAVHHDTDELGCLFATALRSYMDVDVAFMNRGGLRATLDAGDITIRDIYDIDPFNNQGVVLALTVADLKAFFTETEFGLYYDGISISNTNGEMVFRDQSGQLLADDEPITVGMNDYLPAIFEAYFPAEKATIQEQTTADMIIEYLNQQSEEINLQGCYQFADIN